MGGRVDRCFCTFGSVESKNGRLGRLRCVSTEICKYGDLFCVVKLYGECTGSRFLLRHVVTDVLDHVLVKAGRLRAEV